MKRILCIPYSPILGDVRRNSARIVELAHAIAATEMHPDLVVFPELTLSGYLLESLVAEAAVSREDLTALAENLTATGMPAGTEWVVGAPLRDGAQIYNVAAVLAGGQIRHMQKKIFLPTYGMFDEARYFSRGNNLNSYEGALGKTAILICEDAWHMELAYAAAETRAEHVVVISSSPARGYLSGGAAFDSTLTWQNRLRVFADSYGQNFIYCNRSGVEDGILFDGSNFVIGGGPRFLPAQTAAIYEKAALYKLGSGFERHAGFGGDSSRQNDLPLVREILANL
ncbi:MAG: hypothetical protein J0L53_06375 [Spirochaetes bacterium]|nr:hypothetical protein [Spirochaetota bacterium]